VEQGVRRFDMGIGDYPFKRGFGAEEIPLYDLIVASDVAAVPRALFLRIKGRLRKNRHLRAGLQHLKQHFGR
jgi:CelD/BcsL family acetyltransferase involved in cellulose biosynthesis